MRKINKYIILIIHLFINFGVVAQGGPPPDNSCCESIYKELIGSEDPNSPTNPLFIEYNKCKQMEAASAGSYCNPILPIDNSIYIYMSMLAAVGLASFVIIRKITHKKTPM